MALEIITIVTVLALLGTNIVWLSIWRELHRDIARERHSLLERIQRPSSPPSTPTPLDGTAEPQNAAQGVLGGMNPRERYEWAAVGQIDPHLERDTEPE